jgi:Ca2+-transporting ATPase
MPSKPVYSLRPGEIFEYLQTRPSGLLNTEVADRLILYGKNILQPPVRRNYWRAGLHHLLHPMAIMLWLSGLIALLAQQPILSLIIFGVIIINAVFSFWRGFRANQAVTKLNSILPETTRIRRENKEEKIPASDIVPGDILILAEGDHVAADARLIEAYGIRTNNSALTGETLPSLKLSDASFQEDLTEIERPNLVFAGTTLVSGTGTAVVFATGMLTQFGRIARMTQTRPNSLSLLQLQLSRLTRQISIIGILLGITILFSAVFELQVPPNEALLLAIGIIVAVIPEGLSPILSLSLAIAVQRLAQSGILVKNLGTVETLGTISVICTDKSGTLTQNQMTVQKIWVSGRQYDVTGIGYNPIGTIKSTDSQPLDEIGLNRVLMAAICCNNSRLIPPSPELPQGGCLGDQTEAALRVAAIKGGIDDSFLPRIHEFPFDPSRKCMSTIHKVEGENIAFIKGSPSEILQKCDFLLLNGKTIPLDEQFRQQIIEEMDRYARKALRVLAVAEKKLPPKTSAWQMKEVESKLTFLGLVGMMDPPRTEVKETIQLLHRAGIRIIMVTGDYGLTAESIAWRIGLLNSPGPRILTGADIDNLDDSQLKDKLDSGETLFARMAPEHKLRLVDVLEKQGEVVAVIGDGVNDVPALRKADVGFAMGKTGTDVARDAADIILTSDDFSSVGIAIREGRASFDNIQKFLTYILSSNVPQVLPFILAAILKIPLALNVIQILIIDLVTDLIPALALGIEKPESDVMNRHPRNRNEPILNNNLFLRSFLWLGLIETFLAFLGFFWVYAEYGSPLPWLATFVEFLPHFRNVPASMDEVASIASTVFFAIIVITQIGNAFACRTNRSHVHLLGWLRNKYLIFGVLFEVVALWLLIYVQPFNTLIGNHPIPYLFWIGILASAPVLYVLEWSRKRISQKIGS